MWRPEDLETALEQCVSRLQRGESFQACLSSYPQMADELAPLLIVAERLARQAVERPDATAALAAGRERFLLAAARYQPRRETLASRLGRMPRQIAGLFAPFLQRGLITAAVAAGLALVLLAGSTMMASANSLPGDPLYPVKRAAETVQLALTFDEQSRLSALRTIDERRIQEARAVQELRKVTEVSFRGQVESFEDSALIAAGLRVSIAPSTRLIGARPAPGRTVSVIALSQPDGELVASLVETLEPTPSLQQTADQGKRTPTAKAERSATPEAVTLRPSPEATQETAQAKPTAAWTLAATQSYTPTLTCTPTLTRTAMLPASSTPSPAATVTPAPPRQVEMRIDGILVRLEPGLWRIADYDVRITADTRIDERAAKAETGAMVHARAIRQGDGTIVALQITVERGPDSPGELVQFQGIIEAMRPNQWTVGGQIVEVLPTTAISGEPHIGWPAEISARRHPSGELRAIEITIHPPQEIPVEFVGTIEEIARDRWKVSGHIVRLDTQTSIEGSVAVGLRVEVRGLELPDGTVRALSIRVRVSPTPSPTPSRAATLTPAVSATGTPLPTAGTNALPTPPPSSSPTPALSGSGLSQRSPIRDVGALLAAITFGLAPRLAR